jgi:hypothetical protein
MTPEQLESLHAAVYRKTGQDPAWIGYWFKNFLESEEIAWAELAHELGTSEENLVLLCLCRTPRSDHFQEDLRVVCERTGAKEEVVARIIRQEQAMMHWRESTSSTSKGWLLAASDHQEEILDEDPAESDDDES